MRPAFYPVIRVPSSSYLTARSETRRLLTPLDLLEDLLTAPAPGVELVRLEALAPGAARLVAVPGEPLRPSQLEVRLDQVGSELEGLLEERLGVLVHLAAEVDEAQVEMGVQRRLLVVVEPDRLGEMLDRLAEDPLLETDVSDVDARERVGRLLHQDLLERRERVIIVAVQHLRPAEQRLRLGLARRELQRPLQRLDRTVVVAQRDQAPALLDVGRGADMVGLDRRPHTREVGRGRFCGRRRLHLLVLVDQDADVFLELRRLRQQAVHVLEEADDLPLHRLPLHGRARGFQPLGDGVVLRAERGDRRVRHQARPSSAAVSASFSFEASSLPVLSTMMVAWSRPTSPVM